MSKPRPRLTLDRVQELFEYRDGSLINRVRRGRFPLLAAPPAQSTAMDTCRPGLMVTPSESTRLFGFFTGRSGLSKLIISMAFALTIESRTFAR